MKYRRREAIIAQRSPGSCYNNETGCPGGILGKKMEIEGKLPTPWALVSCSLTATCILYWRLHTLYSLLDFQ